MKDHVESLPSLHVADDIAEFCDDPEADSDSGLEDVLGVAL